MGSLIFKIGLVAVFIALRFALRKNTEQKKSVPKWEVEEDEAPDTEYQEEPIDMMEDEDEEEFMEDDEPLSDNPSMTEEFAKTQLFEEGSNRWQHSSQYEALPQKPMVEHENHPSYEEGVEEEEVEMTAEKMRQALIYQVILERPNL
ncbi:MAG: hypothetical protein MJZ01_06700 [Bacteroidales bacterium]|nr:hypothetical protein [Bacteroidales bacterium]